MYIIINKKGSTMEKENTKKLQGQEAHVYKVLKKYKQLEGIQLTIKQDKEIYENISPFNSTESPLKIKSEDFSDMLTRYNLSKEVVGRAIDEKLKKISLQVEKAKAEVIEILNDEILKPIATTTIDLLNNDDNFEGEALKKYKEFIKSEKKEEKRKSESQQKFQKLVSKENNQSKEQKL